MKYRITELELEKSNLAREVPSDSLVAKNADIQETILKHQQIVFDLQRKLNPNVNIPNKAASDANSKELENELQKQCEILSRKVRVLEEEKLCLKNVIARAEETKHEQLSTCKNEIQALLQAKAHDHNQIDILTKKLVESEAALGKFAITSGSKIRLFHYLTGLCLHSHAIKLVTGSQQQEVTCYCYRDDNDWFYVRTEEGGAINNENVITLEHMITGNYLHSHSGFKSATTGQQEVTCYTHRDSNDLWILLNLEDHKVWRVGDKVRLIHKNTGHALHSHHYQVEPTKQQEVTCYEARDDNDLWVVYGKE